MKMVLVTVFLLVTTMVHAAGITLGIGCANPCGQEVAEPGGTAECIVAIGNPSSDTDLIVIRSAQVAITHADGDETLELVDAPITIVPGTPENDTTVVLPFSVAVRPVDLVGTRIFMHEDIQGEVLFGGTSSSGPVDFGGSGTAVTVVADAMCDVTTTTIATTTTTTTLPLPPLGLHVPNGHAWGWHRKHVTLP